MDNLQNTESEEIIEEVNTDTHEESETTDSGQGNEAPDRYKALFTETGDEKAVEEKPKETTTEEKPKEKPEEVAEEEIVYEDDKIIFTGKDGKTELIKVVNEDGTFAYVPESLKDGYLRQADYTKKTMAVAEERKAIEAQKAELEYVRNEAFALKYIDELGGLTEQPLEKDYLNPDGKYYSQYETEEDAIKAYKADTQKWLHKAELDTAVKQTINTNTAMINAFVEKYGEEEYSEVAKEAQKYINPFIFKNLAPYPPEALEVLRKGLRYDKDLAEAKKGAKVEALKTFNEKPKRTVLKSTHNPTPKVPDVNIPKRYQDIFNEIENNK